MQSLKKLGKDIEDLLALNFKGNNNYLFCKLENTITDLVHIEKKQGRPKDKKWLGSLFQKFRDNTYRVWYNDIKNICENIEISGTKGVMPQGRVIVILPYEKSYILRIVQMRSMIKKVKFWYIPLEHLPTNLKDDVLLGLGMCIEQRILILRDLENNENENKDNFSFIQKAVEKPLTNITKIILITNRSTHKIRDAIISYSEQYDWMIQPDADEITLNDLVWNVNYKSFKVKFQGEEVCIRDLPSCDNFLVNLSGDSLIDFIKLETLNIGSSAVSKIDKDIKYQPRWFAPMKYEINYNGLKTEKNINSYITSYKNKTWMKPLPLHIFKNINISELIQFRKGLEKDEDRLKYEEDVEKMIESSILKPLNSLFETILKYVIPNACIDRHDEQSFIKAFNLKDHKQLVIISGETGSGKSTTLKELAKMQKKKFPRKWTIFINLSGHPHIENDKFVEEIDENWVKKFLLAAVLNGENSFVERYFESCHPKDIVVFIDSFDEVCKSYIIKSFNLINVLINMKVFRVVIGCRYYEEVMLFNQWPDCAIYHLVAINYENQLEMVENMLKVNSRTLSKDQEKTLLHLQHELRNESSLKIGESLILQMLTRNIYCDSKYATKPFTVFDLFKTYIKGYIRHIVKHKIMDSIKNPTKADVRPHKKNFYKTLGHLALKEKLESAVFEKIVPKSDRKSLNHSNLMISYMTGLTPQNLKCQAIQSFFFAHAMHTIYYDKENCQDLDDFWKIFNTFIAKRSLERYFFVHLLSKKLDTKIEKEKVQCLLEKMKGNSEALSEELLKLPGISELYPN